MNSRPETKKRYITKLKNQDLLFSVAVICTIRSRMRTRSILALLKWLSAQPFNKWGNKKLVFLITRLNNLITSAVHIKAEWWIKKDQILP